MRYIHDLTQKIKSDTLIHNFFEFLLITANLNLHYYLKYILKILFVYNLERNKHYFIDQKLLHPQNLYELKPVFDHDFLYLHKYYRFLQLQQFK